MSLSTRHTLFLIAHKLRPDVEAPPAPGPDMPGAAGPGLALLACPHCDGAGAVFHGDIGVDFALEPCPARCGERWTDYGPLTSEGT